MLNFSKEKDETAKTDHADILRDLSHDLASSDAPANVGGTAGPGAVAAPKLKCNISRGTAGLLVRIKNGATIRALSSDLNDAGKEIVRGVYQTSDSEIELYKGAIEESFDLYGTPELIETINKWAGSPIMLILEHEAQKIATLRVQLNQTHRAPSREEKAP